MDSYEYVIHHLPHCEDMHLKFSVKYTCVIKINKKLALDEREGQKN